MRHRAAAGVPENRRLKNQHATPLYRPRQQCCTSYLIGLGTLDQRMLILVDIDNLMSSAEMRLIEKSAA